MYGPGSTVYGARGLVRAQADRIYLDSARSNDAMPPGPDDIPREDRDRLGLWLACGAP